MVDNIMENVFKSFNGLQNFLYFSKDTDVCREVTYSRQFVIKLAEIRSMTTQELGIYLKTHRKWYMELKDSNVHAWSNKDSSYVKLYDYALNRKRAFC